MKNLLFFILFSVGCGYVNIPFDKSPLVIVELDQDFYYSNVTTASEAAWIKLGLHYWDSTGVRFRVPEELSESEAAQAAPHLSIGHSTLNMGEYGGNYWPGSRSITLYTGGDLGNSSASNWTWQSVTAHELGHLMQLSHLSDREAIMNGSVPSVGSINDNDLREFYRVWPDAPKS